MRIISDADCLVPDGVDLAQAWGRTRVLGVGAHPDDLELMALQPVLDAAAGGQPSFGAVLVCDGAGSVRAGAAQGLDAAALRRLRRGEQEAAARLGRYSVLVQLGWHSDAVRVPGAPVVAQLERLLTLTRPELLLSHDLADRHDTHVAVALRLLEALRRLPPQQRPRRWLGCEVWRSLDWQAAGDRVALGLKGDLDLAGRLLAAHQSQVSGKGYLDAARGRRRANAVFGASHAVEAQEEAVLAMDLTPLLLDDTLTARAFLEARIGAFRDEALGRLEALQVNPDA